MPDQSVLLDKVRQYWEYVGKDVDRSHEIYHDDAVLEFPQSGERFEGVANFREPRHPSPITDHPRRDMKHPPTICPRTCPPDAGTALRSPS